MIPDPGGTETEIVSMNTRWGYDPISRRDRERDGKFLILYVKIHVLWSFLSVVKRHRY